MIFRSNSVLSWLVDRKVLRSLAEARMDPDQRQPAISATITTPRGRSSSSGERLWIEAAHLGRIGDPLNGKRTMTHAEFARQWRFVGVALRRSGKA